MPKIKWFTWSGVLGASIASWGLLWQVLWSLLVRHDRGIFWLTFDLRSPLGARLMVWCGAALFVVGSCVGLLWGSRKNL